MAESLNNLEYYREVWINGHLLESELLKGDISINVDQGKISLCNFSMYNESNNVPIALNPISASRNMIMQSVKIRAGYKRGIDEILTLFDGNIQRADMVFDESGRTLVTLEAYSYGYSMSTKTRREVYPSFQRDDDPVTDDEGVEVREAIAGDSRTWSVISTGEDLTLKQIIEGIVGMYDVTIGEISPPYDSFNGITKELHQTNESDWAFLKRIAIKYGCHMTIDEKDGKFYFVEKELIRDEKVVSASGQRVEQNLSFYYHRYDRTETNSWLLTPASRMDPVRKDAALPMLDVSYSFDATAVMGGLMRQSTDKDGSIILTAAVIGDDNKISYEKFEIREDRLETAEAKAWMDEYEVGVTTWEDTKKFWKSQAVELQHDPGSRDNPPVIKNANLEFTTFGNIYVVPMRRYKCYNLGFGPRSKDGEDSAALLCVGIKHMLGETYKMKLSFWAF